jgi:hypothetical protein
MRMRECILSHVCPLQEHTRGSSASSRLDNHAWSWRGNLAMSEIKCNLTGTCVEPCQDTLSNRLCYTTKATTLRWRQTVALGKFATD